MDYNKAEQVNRIKVRLSEMKAMVNWMNRNQLDQTEAWAELSLEQMRKEVSKHGT